MTPQQLPIIPRPTRMNIGVDSFDLNAETRILVTHPHLTPIAGFIAHPLRVASGLPLPIRDAEDEEDVGDSDILFAMGQSEPALGQEGYALDVTPDNIMLIASHPAGLFRGAQTLRQLLPPEIEAGRPAPDAKWSIPCLRIDDQPRFTWRGYMLDCARHFMSTDTIKRTLDIIAQLKLNVFHWGLTNDQGWRIAIDRYPKLTEVGAVHEDDPTRHGFYSKDDIREIVAYAGERHIMVVPEINMPGHSFAAMLAYPELSCTKAPERNKGHQRDLYCAGRESVYEFIENVLDEIVELFPAPFVHIGGDEAPKDRWKECPLCQEVMQREGLKDEEELQGYFTSRVGTMLAARKRRLIGWEEIIEGADNLPGDAVVHWWRHRQQGSKYAAKAAGLGHHVIASPNSFTYLCFPTDSDENFVRARTLDLREAYKADLEPEGLSTEERTRVLGGQACMWTEYTTEAQVDEYAFPRLLAIAENLWSSRIDKDFDAFYERVQAMYARLDVMGVGHGNEFRQGGSENE